jgi:hypothetical protein
MWHGILPCRPTSNHENQTAMRYTHYMRRLFRYLGLPLLTLMVFIIPVSPNYNLRQLNIGDGGGGTGQSNNFKAQQTFGELGNPLKGTNYNGGIGFGFTQMANVPTAPTFTNPANYYNKLHVVVNQANNPADTKFALAISTDNFATTQYVKSDTTVGASLVLSDYQTYVAWGSGSGFDVIGLTPATTYYIKAKAYQGNYSESGFGPVASASTVTPSLSFDIDVSPIDTKTSPPYSTNLGTLLAGSVTTSTDKIWIDLDTNAALGGVIYIVGANNGLSSARTSTTLSAMTGDLAAAGSGFGLQGSSATQTSGGPLSIVSPFNGTSDVVGAESTLYQPIFSSSAAIVAGRGSFVLKAKPTSLTPSSDDYTEILTLIAAADY